MKTRSACNILTISLFLGICSSCGKKNIIISSSVMLLPDSLAISSSVIANGDDGYNSYRIPAIVKTRDGQLIAFVEGRVNSSADFGNVKIIEKKSMDNGKTWSASIIVAQNGNLQADNATPIIDYTDPSFPNGRIFLFYCSGNNTQANVTNLNGVREVWYITSTDSGNSWTAPVNITLLVHHPYQPGFNPAYTDPLQWTAYATGPCHALQVTQGSFAGRIVVPFNHGVFAKKTNYAAVFYTDDHGKTFHISPDATLQSDETTVAELSGGGIVLNSRNQYLPGHDRIISFDYSGKLDNTTQWGSAFNTGLPEPVCQGSMLNYTSPAGVKVLLFCNPTDIGSRSSLGVRQSFDDGKTWTSPLIVDGGYGAYSDIVALPDGHLGVLYEANNYLNIRFVSFKYASIPVH